MLFPGVNALVSPDDVTQEDSSEVGGRRGVTRDTALLWNEVPGEKPQGGRSRTRNQSTLFSHMDANARVMG